MLHPRTGLAILSFLLVAACGGGDDATVTPVVDAPPPDMAIDAAPVCAMTMCGADCVDTTTSEQHCGDCTTACDPGQACLSSHCACPPAFVPADPSFVQQQVTTAQGGALIIGFGGMFNSTVDALVVGYPAADATVGTPITLDGSTTPPFVGAGYDLDLNNNFTPTASFFATSGTLTFTQKCSGGFAGHLDNATFSAVSGLMNPTPIANGCTFHVDVVNFAFGTACT